MGRKQKMIWLFILIIIFATGCKKGQSKDMSEVEEEIQNPIMEEQEEEIIPVKEGIPSPLSGIYAPEDKVNKRVVGVMFDNHPSARWQAGLKDAEIVYEFQVEAPYTRYLGLFLINEPESLGPIRSARPYFVTTTLEYDAIYVRVGGSEAAKADIQNLHMADIDGLSSSSKVFWRNNSKRAPHNLYTNMDIIRETQEERGYRSDGNFQSFRFYEDDMDKQGSPANRVKIDYKHGNTTEYLYNNMDKVYNRRKDGVNHIDEIDNRQIIAKNIIIQEVNTKVIDKEGRLQIDLIGEGTGQYISNGVSIDIKWVKNERASKTLYYTENGQELTLNPGVTWIQIVNPNMEIIIE